MTSYPRVSFSHHDGAYTNKQSRMNCDVDILLPIDYVLGDGDVLCGRSKKCLAHPGSENLRRLVQTKLEAYIDAPTKTEKSIIIRDVVNEIHEGSSNSGFVKYDPLTGRYYDVGETMAREKTSQAFRDALHGYYKRSNLSKVARRQHNTKKASLDDVSVSISSKSSSSSNGSRFSQIESQAPYTLVQMTVRDQQERQQRHPTHLYQNQCNESTECPISLLVHAATDDNLTYLTPETKQTMATTTTTSSTLETQNSLIVSTGVASSSVPSTTGTFYRRHSLDWDELSFLFPENACTSSDDDPFEPIPIRFNGDFDFSTLL